MTLNRRTFVKLGALSSVALGAHAKSAFADQDAPVRPMANQAKPITHDEYLQRQETARRYMHEAGIDAIFLTGGTSLQYFTGAQWGLSERLFAMVLPAKGDLAWVAPAFEKGRALEQIKFGSDVRTWQEDESPYQLVASILKDRGCHIRQNRRRGNGEVRFLRRYFESCSCIEARQRRSGDRSLPAYKIGP